MRVVGLLNVQNDVGRDKKSVSGPTVLDMQFYAVHNTHSALPFVPL